MLRPWVSRFDIWPYLERFAADSYGEILQELGRSPDLLIGNYRCGTYKFGVCAVMNRPSSADRYGEILQELGRTPDLLIRNYRCGKDTIGTFAARIVITAGVIAGPAHRKLQVTASPSCAPFSRLLRGSFGGGNQSQRYHSNHHVVALTLVATAKATVPGLA